MLQTHVNFFLLRSQQNLMPVDPDGWGKGTSELLTFTGEIFSFFRVMSTKISMKMQNCKMRFFSLLIGQLVKGGTIRGM